MRMSPRFPLGSCVATPGAVGVLENDRGDWRTSAADYLARHQGGDWGDVPPKDARENELSVRECLWVITEADRSSTCILLPEEY